MYQQKCSCGAMITFLKRRDRAGKEPVRVTLVDEHDRFFDPAKHESHFADCPHADRYRKGGKAPQTDQQWTANKQVAKAADDPPARPVLSLIPCGTCHTPPTLVALGGVSETTGYKISCTTPDCKAGIEVIAPTRERAAMVWNGDRWPSHLLVADGASWRQRPYSQWRDLGDRISNNDQLAVMVWYRGKFYMLRPADNGSYVWQTPVDGSHLDPTELIR